MADKDLVYQDVENSESLENLSNDDWTIVGENCFEKNDNEDDTSNVGTVNDTQEIFRGIDVLATPDDNTTEDESKNDCTDKQCEDSDGISVITESEAEQLVVRKKFGEIDSCKDHLCNALNKYEKPGEKTTPQVGTILNVVIACSLAAIIGLGAGRILGIDDKCPVSNAIDFSTIKMESDMLINQIRELSEVKYVLDEIKASIPQIKEARKEYRHSGSKSRPKRAVQKKKPLKISETYVFDPDTTVLEQLQTSLSTLCSVIDEINVENDFLSSDTAQTRGIVTDLIKFKKLIYRVTEELGNKGRPKEVEFLKNAEKKIRDVSKSLLSDLTYTIHGLTIKIHNKLNKVRHKLNKRLCLLKISESIDAEKFKPLEENNSFLESCDKVLNVTLNPSVQSVKSNKKKSANRNICLKTKNSFNRNSPEKYSDSEKNYSGYSSSDSSMPDLSYDQDTDSDFWNEKQEKKKNSKQKSNKSFSADKKEYEKIENAKCIKSSKDSQSWKDFIKETLMPAETCPVTQVSGFKIVSAPQKTPRFETSTSNKRPLYSAVLKSVNDTAVSSQNDPGKQKGFEREITVEASMNSKENRTETKHNVTPAESDSNVLQNIKIFKKQWNANVQQPIVKYYEFSRHEEVLTERNEDPQLLKNTEQKLPLTAPLKRCRKGKKCPNDSTASTESKKKPVVTTSPTDNIEHKKIMDKKPSETKHDHDGKKFMKEKYYPNISSSSKITKKNKRDFKNRKNNQKEDIQLAGDWQLKRSQAREMYRHHNQRSEWFFDRADFRQDARKNINTAQSTDRCQTDKCQGTYNERTSDEEYYDHKSKKMKAQKYSSGPAGFMAKKKVKMPHRKNIMQSKHFFDS